MSKLLELYRMAEREGIEVDCFDLNKRESMSVMDEDGDCFIAIDPFKLTSTQDETVKLSHEIGHCVTGSFYNRFATCDVRQRHENRADKWAIQKLVPRKDLDRAIKEGYTEIWELSEYFDVTEDFMQKVICWYKYGNLDVDSYF